MTTFKELGLSERALEAVRRLAYETPTSVQQQAIPLVLEGRDVIAAAKTGTGKTAAFSLPSMDKIGRAEHRRGPLMLVITPTRELAEQIGEVCRTIAVSTHHRILTVVGGLSYNPQIAQLKNGVDVLIATPGRLIDLMERKAVTLEYVEVLVLDEADRMLDMGFLPDVKKIVAATPQNRQTLLFSATVDDAVRNSTGSLLHEPALVEVAHQGDVADIIDQYIVKTVQGAKSALLEAVLNDWGAERVIVFARTRGRVDSCVRKLTRRGFLAEGIHSDKSQAKRKRALDAFAQGKINIIVATDVLSRGIDVDQVDYVVNFDMPMQPEDYVHRIGRTGRAGSAGRAVSFVTPENRAILKDIEKFTKQHIPEVEIKEFDEEAAELAAQARAARAADKKDPDIVQATKELKAKERRRRRAKERASAAKEATRAKAAGKSASARQAAAEQSSTDATRFAVERSFELAADDKHTHAEQADFAAKDSQQTSSSAPSSQKGKRRASNARNEKRSGQKNASARTRGGETRSKSSKHNGRPCDSKASAGQRSRNRQDSSASHANAKNSSRRDSAQHAPGRKKNTAQSPKSDMRPGRAHRAALARTRNKRSR